MQSQGGREKWIAATIWVGLLVAALYTTSVGVGAANFVVNYSSNVFRGLFTTGLNTTPSPNQMTAALIANIISLLVAIGVTARVWLGVVRLTRQLVLAFARSNNSEEERIFPNLLIFPVHVLEKDEDDELDLDEAESDLPSEIVRSLLYAWATYLAMSFAVSIVFMVVK